MPPRPPHHPKHDPPGHPDHRPHHPHHSRAASLSFVDRSKIDAILAPLIPDARERALVLRCLLEEGPAHHRGTNAVFIELLSSLAGPLTPSNDGVPVPMRLPPHVKAHSDSVYALRLPLAPLEELRSESGDVESMVECLLDGPPQHYLANVVMIILLDAIHQRLKNALAGDAPK